MKGDTAVELNELHVGPSAYELHLCQFTTHVVAVVFQRHGVGFGQIEVTLVDDLVVAARLSKAFSPSSRLLKLMMSLIESEANSVGLTRSPRNSPSRTFCSIMPCTC